MKPTKPSTPPKAPSSHGAHSPAHIAADGHAHEAQAGHGADALNNDKVEHEHSDVNVRAILSFAGIITVVTVVCAIIVWGMFGMFERMAAGRDPQLSPLAMPAAPLPETTAMSPYFSAAPEPRLLTNEPAVLGALREAEQKQMQGYGWIDEKTGVAHLPIDQAKKLVVERGLPARAAAASPTLGTHLPALGEASGGRLITNGGAAPGRAQTPAVPAESRPPDPTANPVSAPTSGRGH